MQQQQQQQQAQRQHPAAQPAPSENQYSRAAFLSHSDAIGMASRRKGRGPPEFQLPEGWQLHTPAPAASSPPAAGAAAAAAAGTGARSAGNAAGKSPSSAAKQQAPQQQTAAQQKQQQQQQQQQAPPQQYLSPEGMVFDSLQAVQSVVQGAVLVPRRLVRWVRQAAADPVEAREAAATASEQGHLLGLARVRVVRVPQERRLMQQRLAAAASAAAATAAGSGRPGERSQRLRRG
jgi:hypothetical protein